MIIFLSKEICKFVILYVLLIQPILHRGHLMGPQEPRSYSSRPNTKCVKNSCILQTKMLKHNVLNPLMIVMDDKVYTAGTHTIH